MQLPDHAPIRPEQRKAVQAALAGLNSTEAVWLSGYLAGQQADAPAAVAPATPAKPAAAPLTILYGTESGNAEDLAQRTLKLAKRKGFKAQVRDMADTSPSDLTKMENLAVIVSTWGEGDPPDRAVSFHKAMLATDAPRLDRLNFSVLALGDTSYEQFCQTGKDFDQRLEALGATRYCDRVDCDVDFEEPYEAWVNGALSALLEKTQATPEPVVVASNGAAAPANGTEALAYGKKNPFPAALSERVLLNGTGSKKETWHLELSLDGSGMHYTPGDALALIPSNATDVVESILAAGHFDAQESVTTKDGAAMSLREALTDHYDITGLNKSILKKYNALAKASRIDQLLEPEQKEELSKYLWGRQLVDLLEEFPVKGLKGADLLGLLRKMPPRLYSIASSLAAHPEEVHLTIASVRYETHGKSRKGVASTYIADDLKVGSTVPVYTHANKNFKLPENTETPIIMVGPGTGIAPFRSFIEERSANGEKGKNWLFFGDQHYSYDFLYQTEWQDYLKDGVLSRLDLAFSRDQPEKIYVQDRMLEHASDLYQWLDDGAYFYVCGDASRMAGDVHNALLTIAQSVGDKSEDDAKAWLDAMKKEKRYQRDVY
ncbi:MAG: assimilatory sulfite reductase (NADPH) flavoprotein subunit [Verrucomicrobiota bacterium]